MNTELKQDVLWVTLNRPSQSNAFIPAMYDQFTQILLDAQANNQVKAVILKANGKNFCTGNDLKAILALDLQDTKIRSTFAREGAAQVRKFALTLINFTKPLVACVHGNVIGFMFTAMALFDAVLVTQDATFQAPMVQSSQSIEMCGSYTFPKLFGHGTAFEILVLGRTLTAQQAIESGYALRLFASQDQMYEGANKLALQIASLNVGCVEIARRMMRDQDKKHLIQINILETETLEQMWNLPTFQQELIQYFSKRRQSRPKL